MAEQQREQALDQITLDLQTILDQSPVLIGAWNADLTNRFANKAYAVRFGWSTPGLRGRHLREFIGADNFERIRPQVEETLRGRPQSFEYAVHLADGSLHHYHVEFVPEQQVDGSTGLLVFALDVTDAVEQRTALANSERRARSVLASMAEGLVVHAADGTVVDANPAAPGMLGMTREQLLGRTPMDPAWQAIREDGSQLPGSEHPAMVALRTGQSLRNQVMGVHTDAHERRWLSVNAQPLWAPDDAALTGAIATFTDITEQRVQQLKAARFHEQIRSLARRFDELRDAERRELAEQLQRGLLAQLVSLKQAAASDGSGLLGQLSAAVEELRHVIFALKPPGIEELGFYEALVRYAGEFGAQVDLPIAVVAPRVGCRCPGGPAHAVPRDPGSADQHRPPCPGAHRGGVGGAGRGQRAAADPGRWHRDQRAGLGQAQRLRAAGGVRTGRPPRRHAAHAGGRRPGHDARGRHPDCARDGGRALATRADQLRGSRYFASNITKAPRPGAGSKKRELASLTITEPW